LMSSNTARTRGEASAYSIGPGRLMKLPPLGSDAIYTFRAPAILPRWHTGRSKPSDEDRP
jgi:hypothetical protein